MIIGMLSMALSLGEGSEQNAPLGRAVIGGLIFATVATLFFVPTVFMLISERKYLETNESSPARPPGVQKHKAGFVSRLPSSLPLGVRLFGDSSYRINPARGLKANSKQGVSVLYADTLGLFGTLGYYEQSKPLHSNSRRQPLLVRSE
jgi:hypothetical protein